MMTQLDVRMGTPPTQSVPEDDAMSFRSDDSGDSEFCVVINQVLRQYHEKGEIKTKEEEFVVRFIWAVAARYILTLARNPRFDNVTRRH